MHSTIYKVEKRIIAELELKRTQKVQSKYNYATQPLKEYPTSENFLKTIFQVMRTLKQIFVNKSLCKNKKFGKSTGAYLQSQP